MRIEVQTSALQAAGQSLEADVSAPLIALCSAAQSVGGTLEGSVGDPGLAGATEHFTQVLGQALQNGGLIAGILGHGLTGGAIAYTVTDQHAMPGG
jgi:hypothetical protein